MRGDILFYRPRDLIGRIIALATHGPFCHVAVSMGDDTVIAADFNGIKRYPTDSSRITPVHPPAGTNVEAGIAWLERQVGLKYGFLDVLDAFFRLTVKTTFFVGRARSYDCSDLVTRYLIECGQADWLGPLAQEPHLVTPNDLARRFGL